MTTPATVTLRRACRIEKPGKDSRGRPSYHWVQGWTYTTPTGGDLCPLSYSEALRFAREDYPGARIEKED